MKIKARMVLPLFLVMVLVVPIIGCGGGVSALSAEELVPEITAASEKIETCQFNMDMVMSMSGEGEGETLDATISVGITGAMDVPNEKTKMAMEIGIDMDLPGEAAMIPIPESMEMEMYIIDSTTYTKMGLPPLIPEQWTKTEVPESEMGSQDFANQQIALLEAAEFEMQDEEIVNGIECYVVTMTLDMDKMMEILMQQPGMSEQMPEGFDIDELFSEMSFEDMVTIRQLKQWYAKETLFPMKSVIDMTLDISSENAGVPVPDGEEFNLTIDLLISMEFSDYNEPVSIELPPEAKNASDTPMLPGMPGMQ